MEKLEQFLKEGCLVARKADEKRVDAKKIYKFIGGFYKKSLHFVYFIASIFVLTVFPFGINFTLRFERFANFNYCKRFRDVICIVFQSMTINLVYSLFLAVQVFTKFALSSTVFMKWLINYIRLVESELQVCRDINVDLDETLVDASWGRCYLG